MFNFTTQIWVLWVLICQRYGISALIPQTSFGGETSGCFMKSWLFSQANNGVINRWSILNPLYRLCPGERYLTNVWVPCLGQKKILKYIPCSGQHPQFYNPV